MPCDATAFLISSIYHFMTHIQGTRGNSSFAYTRSPLKTICISICLRIECILQISSEGEHCQGRSLYIYLELWWHHVFYVTGDDVSSICIYKYHISLFIAQSNLFVKIMSVSLSFLPLSLIISSVRRERKSI